MIQTLPLNSDDIAVTHLSGGVTVSTRAVRHVGLRPGEEITNYETMILIPGGHVDGPDTRDRALAVGQHISVVSALLGGAALSSIGLVAMDEPDGRTERSTLSMHRCRALSRDVLRAALPHLLPGLYVAPLETDHGKPCIWVDDPDHPGQPVPLMTEQEHPRLFAILAALLPDRTEDEEE